MPLKTSVFVYWYLKPVRQNCMYSIHTSVFHPPENLTYQYGICNNFFDFDNLHILIISTVAIILDYI